MTRVGRAGPAPGARLFPPYLVEVLHRLRYAVGICLVVGLVPLHLPLLFLHGLDDRTEDALARQNASARVRAAPGRVRGAVVLRVAENLLTRLLGDAGTHSDAPHGEVHGRMTPAGIAKSAPKSAAPRNAREARSEERGGCIAPPNATNFGEKVEPVVLDSLSSVASAPGVGAARATPSGARGGEIWVFGWHRSFSEHENRMETSLKSEQIGVNRSSEFSLV